MTVAHPDPFLHHLRHLTGNLPAAALTDGQLLERFLAHRDETAVEVLVRRYGPLVFGVCRRVLHDAHTAEDAFQATFLVLMRKAPSLDRARPLGSYLCTVAYRLALRARASEQRRQRCRQQAALGREPAVDPTSSPSDLLVVLEEELHRLPEKHRAPLVLCYLEGKTNEEAAQLLGCPRGSIAARLAQARDRLREGLARRGFVAPAAAIAAALTSATRAAVPLPLLDATVRGAAWFAGDTTCVAGSVSAGAVALARRGLREVLLNRIKVAGAVLLVAALLGTGASMLLKAAPPAGSPTRAVEQPTARAANAALPYGQAFIALRRLPGVGDETRFAEDCLTMPPDARARQMVSQAAYALRMLQRGAARPRCDWAVDAERGIDLPFTRAGRAGVLASVAGLRARLRFEEGHHRDAINDVVAALTLARHVSLDGTLDGLWAGQAIEHRLGQTLAAVLPRLDARTMQDLSRRLRALPPAGSVATATLRMEQSLLSWIEGEVKEAKDREDLLAFLTQLCGDKGESPEKNAAKARAFLQECGGSAKDVLRFAQEMRSRGAALAKKLDLPPDQRDSVWEREVKKLAGNPVFKVFAPALDNVRHRQTQADIRRALLAAALAVQLHGKSALKKHPDPVLGGPFAYAAFEGGFELRSRWKSEERFAKGLTLTVGRRGK